jgi:hypothetical protein
MVMNNLLAGAENGESTVAFQNQKHSSKKEQIQKTRIGEVPSSEPDEQRS